jgi:hypothetical protein
MVLTPYDFKYCKYCKAQIILWYKGYYSDGVCDNCWEVKHRINSMPKEVIEKLLKDIDHKD